MNLTLGNAPIGTKAPAIGGGFWMKTAQGWRWNNIGSTFPRPGGDWNGDLIAPAASPVQGAAVVGGVRPYTFEFTQGAASSASGANRAADRSVIPKEKAETLIGLLESLRPEYGAVGSRDVDVAAARIAIDEAVKIVREWALADRSPDVQQVVGQAVAGWVVRERRAPDGTLRDCFVEAPREPHMAYALEVLGDDYEGYGDVERKLEHCKLIVAAVNAYTATPAPEQEAAQIEATKPACSFCHDTGKEWCMGGWGPDNYFDDERDCTHCDIHAAPVPAATPAEQAEPKADELAYGHRQDYYLMANARRVALNPISQIRTMQNWVFAGELFATGSTSARQICRDAGIDPDGYEVIRATATNTNQPGNLGAANTNKGGAPLTHCAAARDGDCTHPQCPQLRDNEPHASGRHCPLDDWDVEG